MTRKELILHSVRDILYTPLGSRVTLRDYGSRLPFLLGALESSTMAFVSEITSALTKWETRIEVKRTSVQRLRPGYIEIEIEAVDKASGGRLRLFP